MSGLDVELAGVGRVAGPWQALFFSFKGVELPRGDPRELDYEVGATDGDGVTLKTKNGATLRLPLAPLR